MSTDIPEVLLNAIFAQDEQTDELHRMLLGWEKRAKAAEATLEKARAVLAEYKKDVQFCKDHLKQCEIHDCNPDGACLALLKLADALGGGHE